MPPPLISPIFFCQSRSLSQAAQPAATNPPSACSPPDLPIFFKNPANFLLESSDVFARFLAVFSLLTAYLLTADHSDRSNRKSPVSPRYLFTISISLSRCCHSVCSAGTTAHISSRRPVFSRADVNVTLVRSAAAAKRVQAKACERAE